jgi:hypothetical protein
MKILCASRSGNVGKSTLARHLLAPRLGDAAIVPVESINADESDENAVRGAQFAHVQDFLLSVDSAVVDLGASNFEDFFSLMHTYAGSHEDFDLFIVPTVPESKQERDTVMTIKSLTELGVPPNKILTVFNKISRPEDIDTGFRLLHAFHAEEKSFVLRRDAVVYSNPIYASLRTMSPQRSIFDIRDDPTDYKAALAAAMSGGADEGEKSRIKELIATKRLATGVALQLDQAFAALMRKGKHGT